MPDYTGDPDPTQDVQDDIEELDDTNQPGDMDDLDPDPDFTDDADDQDQDSGDADAGDDFDLKKFSENFKDKSPDELIKIIADKERELGRKGGDVGDLRDQIKALEQRITQGPAPTPAGQFDFAPPQQQPGYGFNQQVPPGPAPTPQGRPWDYEKPEESTVGIVRNEISMYEQVRQMREVGENINKSRASFERGSKVLDAYPNLFAGIENEVKQGMYAYYYPSVMNGHDVSPYLLGEDAWITVAQNLRIKRGEFDRIKPTRTPTAVSHQAGDSPRRTKQGRVGKRPVGLNVNDGEVKTIMRVYKLSREEAEDIIRQEQDMGMRGERR